MEFNGLTAMRWSSVLKRSKGLMLKNLPGLSTLVFLLTLLTIKLAEAIPNDRN